MGPYKKKDEALISTWERKVLRKIFGPVNEKKCVKDKK
jgi:hypothetical protein